MMNIKEEENDEHHPNPTSPVRELPSVILITILSGLSVQTLSRFRCVSKTWRNMISNPSFAKLHLSKSPTVTIDSEGTDLYMTEFNVDADCLRSFGPITMNPKFCPSVSKLRPIASCNGLIFLSDPERLRDPTYCVCNPILGQYTKLPKSKRKSKSNYEFFRGFGFNPSSNQYKVLVQPKYTNELEINTVGTAMWRSIGFVPQFEFVSSLIGTYFNGVLHWLVYKGKLVFISCLDLGSEEFSLISAPESPDFTRGKGWGQNFVSKNIFLGASGGHLYISNNVNGSYLDLWVMKDYGDEDSWIKEWAIKLDSVFEHFLCRPVEVLNYGTNGAEMIMLCRFSDIKAISFLVAYNLEGKGMRMLEFDRITSKHRPVPHVPSFISLADDEIGGNY